MKRKILFLSALAVSALVATPAFAWTWKPPQRPPVSSTSGGAPSSTGGSHQVPEPGMLGLMGAGLAGIAIARRRKARR